MKQTLLQEKEYYLISTELIHKIQGDLGSLASYIPNHFEDLASIAHQLGDNEIITSPIEFDAKKVVEEMYESWEKYLQVTFGVVKKVQLKSILIKHLDNNTTYTPTQRQQILTELEKI